MSMDAMAAAEKLPETENDGRISVSDDAPIPATSSEETKPPPGEISDEAGLRIAIEEELRRLIIEQAVFDAADSRLRGGDGEEVSEIVEEGNRSTDSGDTATEKFLRLFQNPDWLRSYPVRADAEDCSYYMKFGSCKYGFFCKFNHPPRPTSQYFKERPKRRDGNSEKTTGCKFIMTSGGCKYGNECKFSHVSEKRFTPEIPELNFLGLPLRPGESECPYYMRNASCKYGANCKFHHPDPTSGGGGRGRSSSPPGFSNGNKAMSSQHAPSSSIASSWETTTPSLQTAMFRGSTDSSDQETKWHQAYPTTSSDNSGLPIPPAYTFPAETNNFPQPPPPPRPRINKAFEEYPERPGEPECSFFMKTGDCKFKSNCKFHHPRSRLFAKARGATKPPPPLTTTYSVNDNGLPLRPGLPMCTHYYRYGICKFGPGCRYDHSEVVGDDGGGGEKRNTR